MSARRYFGDNLAIVSRDGGSITPDTGDRIGSDGELALGGEVSFTRAGFFLEASRATGVDMEREWGAALGLRYRW